MSTKTQTQTTNQYDPTSLGTYQGLQLPLGNQLQQYISNPFGNPMFQLSQQMGTRQAQNLGGTGISNVIRNLVSSGMQNSPAGLEMMNNQMRANTGTQAQLGFQNPMIQAFQNQLNAMQMSSQYRPLQIGNTQVQSKSGLGTLLPQLLAAGAGIAAAPFTGGLSLAGLGATSGLFMGGSPNALAGTQAANNAFIGGMNTQMGGGDTLVDPWANSPGSTNSGGSYGNPFMPGMGAGA